MTRHLLDPELPYDMADRVEAAVGDLQLQQYVNTAARNRDTRRVGCCRDTFGENYDAMRRLAGRIKQHTLDHLDLYLERFIDHATAAGTHVHFAADGAEANEIAVKIAKDHGCTACVKSKSMVTEETHLVPALESIGVETLETDLGEFIVQLDGDAPSHIVTPIIHKNRVGVAETFRAKLDAAYTEDPAALTDIARGYMRKRFREADLGISGGNFLVAQTGSVVICTNEGNGNLSTGAPRVHVAFVGIEKLIPKLEHLGVFLKLLARSGTGQPITVYTTMLTGPRRPAEHDGPEHVHVVLIDNGRTEVLREETRELLRCIRCGACLNACPVFRKVGGGHAYGAVYSGPIGAVITPIFKGLHNYPDLPHASSLCGACFEACPVHIDIPKHLVQLRRDMNDAGITSWRVRLLHRVWAASLKRSWTYRIGAAVQRYFLRGLGHGGEPDGPYDDQRWIGRMDGPLAGWTSQRDMPTPTSRSFRDWWRAERGGDA